MLSGIIGVIIAFSVAFGRSVSIAHIDQLILSRCDIRFLYAVIRGGPAWLLVLYLKKKENIDVYDTNTNFNPLKLSLKD